MRIIIITVVSFCLLLATRCTNHARAKQNAVTSKPHWLSVNNPAGDRLYIDSVPASAAITTLGAGDANTSFRCFVVGFEKKKIAQDDKEKKAWQYFLQYQMPQQWAALVDGDSLSTVYYEPRVKVQEQRDECLLVFEVPKSRPISAFVFRDSIYAWGTTNISTYQN